MLDRADCADFGCHNSIRLETKHFLNTLALTFISFSGRFVFAMQKHYLFFFCKRSSCFISRRRTPKLKFLHTSTFDHRVHKSIKNFSNSFSHYTPVLWNSLPFQIRNSPSVASFRKHLKTHLFNSSFPT